MASKSKMPSKFGQKFSKIMSNFKRDIIETVIIHGLPVRYYLNNDHIFFCLTDMAKSADTTTDVVLQSYLKNANNLEFLANWEERNNPDFNPHRLVGLKTKLGLNSYYLSAKTYIEAARPIGLTSTAGRYGGTFVHEDIALQFMTWFDSKIFLDFLAEFKRLKNDEIKRLGLGQKWDLRREIARANYAIHADAVRENLVPLMEQNTPREAFYFASEADLLNVALFGMTAKQWRFINPDASGNMRDEASDIELLVLANLESQNATLLEMGFSQEERLEVLSRRAKREIQILEDTQIAKNLGKMTGRKKLE
jgi:hypothetical protein